MLVLLNYLPPLQPLGCLCAVAVRCHAIPERERERKDSKAVLERAHHSFYTYTSLAISRPDFSVVFLTKTKWFLLVVRARYVRQRLVGNCLPDARCVNETNYCLGGGCVRDNLLPLGPHSMPKCCS